MPVTLAFGGLCYERVLINKTNNIALHVINIVIAAIGMTIVYFIKIDSNQFQKLKKSK